MNRRQNWMVDPSLGWLGPTILVVLLYLSGTIYLTAPTGVSGGLIFLFSLPALAALGGTVARSLAPPPSDACRSVSSGQANKLAMMLGAVSLLHAAFFVLDLYQQGGLTLDFYESRMQLFEGRKVGVFTYASSVTSPAVLIGGSVLILLFERISTSGRWFLAAGVIGALGTVSVLSAGRFYLVGQAIISFWFAMHRPLFGVPVIPRSKTFRLVAVVLGCLVAAAIPAISISRSIKEDQAAFALEYFSPLILPSQELLFLINESGRAVGTFLSEATTYWTSSVAVFERLYLDWNSSPTVVGMHFPVIHRRLGDLGVVEHVSVQIERWQNFSGAEGFYDTVWATTAFDVLKAFGKAGGFFYAFVAGFIGTLIHRLARNSASISLLVLAGLMWFHFFSWFQRSIFLDPIYEYSIYWGVAALVFSSRATKVGRVDPATMRVSAR